MVSAQSHNRERIECLIWGLHLSLQAAGLDVTTPEPLPTDHPVLALHNCGKVL